MTKPLFLCIAFFLLIFHANGDNKHLLDTGWKLLMQDNDTQAIKLFYQAYEKAKNEKDTEGEGDALLKLGIASYGSSIYLGMLYASRALAVFEQYKSTDPAKASMGRYKCLQLIATIKAREGKFTEAVQYVREALEGFEKAPAETEYRGLAYSLLGSIYQKIDKPDSSEFYHRQALHERELNHDMDYLASSYNMMGEIECRNNHKAESKLFFDKSIALSDSMGNRQSLTRALTGLSKWYLSFEGNGQKADSLLQSAKKISLQLTDKTFYLNVLNRQKELHLQKGDYQQAFILSEQILSLKDSIKNWETERLTQNLEVQFGIAEKDRKLLLIRKEHEISKLTNFLLAGSLLFLGILALGAFSFFRKINKRDKLLLATKEELVKSIGKEKALSEQQMQNEIEFKESQLNAMTIQMLQKNDLMLELKERIEASGSGVDASVSKVISKGLLQEKEWDDFNKSFESINKNFYNRIKMQYPEISPGELKICALMKMNMNTKDMASILNISPESVKTARYRLRKKFQLNTEDNLTDFILSL